MIEWLDIRTLIRIAFGLLAAYLLFLAAAFALMRQPPERFASAIGSVPRQLFLIVPFETLWSNARAGRLELGAEAPDFDLESLDKKSRVRLSSLRGEKPVALIFGSYTWPPFRREVPALNRIYEQYKDRAAFYVVYIQEAHASDVWQLPVNIRQGVVFASPKSYEERGGVAESCVRKLNIRVPALVDGFDNATEQAYTAWPDRLYVVDMNGRIAYKSSPGPFGFKPRQVEEALSKLLR